MRRLLACLLLPLLVQSAHACTKTVRWADDGPYFYRTADGQVSGFSAELTREILRRVGCEVEFVEMPWARALVQLENGRVDILTGAFIKPERQKFAWFSQPIGRSTNVLFMSADAAKKYPVQRLEDLAGTDFRLAVQINVAYGGEFEALSAKPEFRKLQKPVPARRNAWQMIALGRLDGLIADLPTGLQEIEQLGLGGKIQPTSIVVQTEPVAYAFSKRTTQPEFVDRFNRAQAAMVADRSYHKLIEKYLPGVIAPSQ